jgi:hypothetical protein
LTSRRWTSYAAEFREEQAADLRVGITRSKLMDEVVGRVPSVHVESEEATILATRVAKEALQSHSVVIENSGVASQKGEYVVPRRE